MSRAFILPVGVMFVALGVGLPGCGGAEPAASPTTAPPAPVADPTDDAPETPAAASGVPAAPPAATAAETPPAPNSGDGSPGPEVPGEEGGEFHEVTPPADASRSLVLPSFSTLIGDGPTVTITVTVDGADAGELAFQTLGDDGFPTMIHVQRMEGSSASVTAPASYPDPIYVSLAMPEGEFSTDPSAVGSAAGTPQRKGAGMQVAGAEEPIRLQGADVQVRISKGQTPAWLAGLASQGVRASGGEEDR